MLNILQILYLPGGCSSMHAGVQNLKNVLHNVIFCIFLKDLYGIVCILFIFHVFFVFLVFLVTAALRLIRSLNV